ncbi:MAG: rod shape-determining protein [Proteobacteria bacterium]|nr:rod shape-determining protein [Pseudomonadota bacterium]
MAYRTIGIDIGVQAIRYVFCQFEIKAGLLDKGVIPIEGGTVAAMDAALGKLASSLSALKKMQIDAIGLSVDPSLVLTAHRSFDFNNPALIEKVLPTSVMDIWKNDGTSQFAFEVGELVKRAREEGEEGEGAQEESYDVRVINYPYDNLVRILSQLKNAQIDPHVMIPANEALVYAPGGLFEVKPSDVYVIIDVGANKTLLSVFEGMELKLSRALKVGSQDVDSSISESLRIPEDEARELKEKSGFVAIPGAEQAVYAKGVQKGAIAMYEGDAVALGQACERGLNVLFQGIRQTLMNYMSQGHAEPTHVYLTGGGSNLVGFDEWLAQYMGVHCTVGLPYCMQMREAESASLDACTAALAAAANIDGRCPMNLRRGRIAHKGSLAFIQENKWILLACVAAVIASIVFALVTHAKAVQEEHDRLKAILEETTQAVFGKKLLTYKQVEAEIQSSQSYSFIPERSAFTDFMWISNNINDNLSDVELDLNSLDIDVQRKTVVIRGETGSDDGLPRFMQLLEQYECFPEEIKESGMSKVRDKISFRLNIKANNCTTGGDSE